MTMKKAQQKNLCIVAGGSGGHVIPALQLAQQWLTDNPEGTVTLFTSTKKIDDVVIKHYPWIHQVVRLSMPPINTKNPFSWLRVLGSTFLAFYKSIRYLKQAETVRVISTGGFVGLPVCLAAICKKIPIDLHELNVIPGKAAYILSLLASRVVITFPATARYFSYRPCELDSYPIRFKAAQRELLPSHTIEHLNATMIHPDTCRFSPQRKTIFLLGGSQGSLQLNHQLRAFLQAHPETHQHLQIIHQTGSKDDIGWTAFYHSLAIPAIVFSYTQHIESYYTLADVVLTRAGAGTLFELLFFNKKSLIVPLVTKNTDHQRDNARAMVASHPELFSMIEQETITHHPNIFYKTILNLLSLETDISLDHRL